MTRILNRMAMLVLTISATIFSFKTFGQDRVDNGGTLLQMPSGEVNLADLHYLHLEGERVVFDEKLKEKIKFYNKILERLNYRLEDSNHVPFIVEWIFDIKNQYLVVDSLPVDCRFIPDLEISVTAARWDAACSKGRVTYVLRTVLAEVLSGKISIDTFAALIWHERLRSFKPTEPYSTTTAIVASLYFLETKFFAPIRESRPVVKLSAEERKAVNILPTAIGMISSFPIQPLMITSDDYLVDEATFNKFIAPMGDLFEISPGSIIRNCKFNLNSGDKVVVKYSRIEGCNISASEVLIEDSDIESLGVKRSQGIEIKRSTLGRSSFFDSKKIKIKNSHSTSVTIGGTEEVEIDLAFGTDVKMLDSSSIQLTRTNGKFHTKDTNLPPHLRSDIEIRGGSRGIQVDASGRTLNLVIVDSKRLTILPDENVNFNKINFTTKRLWWDFEIPYDRDMDIALRGSEGVSFYFSGKVFTEFDSSRNIQIGSQKNGLSMIDVILKNAEKGKIFFSGGSSTEVPFSKTIIGPVKNFEFVDSMVVKCAGQCHYHHSDYSQIVGSDFSVRNSKIESVSNRDIEQIYRQKDNVNVSWKLEFASGAGLENVKIWRSLGHLAVNSMLRHLDFEHLPHLKSRAIIGIRTNIHKTVIGGPKAKTIDGRGGRFRFPGAGRIFNTFQSTYTIGTEKDLLPFLVSQ
jgi:hypothetical protein